MHSLLSTRLVKKLALGYTVLILLLVTLPINGDDQPLGKLNHNYIVHIRLDYVAHALLFIPWLLLIGYGWKLDQKDRIRLGFTVLLTFIFAVSCEYIQLLLPYRTFNIDDLLANNLGITIGYLLLWGWSQLRKPSR